MVGTERGISELQQLSGALRGQASDKPEKADRVARGGSGITFSISKVQNYL